MTNWQFFYTVDGRATADKPPWALGRTDRDGPRYNAQMLVSPARWRPSEFLARYHLLGTNEDDYVEISEDRAIGIIEDWVASGRLSRWPDEPKRRVT
jgi:hypothetical protein